jgi:hypothetical protein
MPRQAFSTKMSRKEKKRRKKKKKGEKTERKNGQLQSLKPALPLSNTNPP